MTPTMTRLSVVMIRPQLRLVALVACAMVALQLIQVRGVQGGNLAANGYNEQWLAGHATWYGDPQGEGSSGGACGYQELTGTPYGPKIVAGNAVVFQNGQGCGQCYDMMCSYPCCKSTPTRVVVTDQCPGGTYCSQDQPAFDLSGAAISAMALANRDGELRNIGLYDIQYKRVPCDYGTQNIVFAVDAGSSAFWLAFTVRYEGGPGDIDSVEVSMGGSSSFQPAQHNWGANWMVINYSGQAFKGPYSIRIISKLNGHSVTAENVIPAYFEPGKLYESNVQFVN